MRILNIFMTFVYGLTSLTTPSSSFHFHDYKNNVSQMQYICNTPHKEETHCVYHKHCPEGKFCLKYRCEVCNHVKTSPPDVTFNNTYKNQHNNQSQQISQLILIPREPRETFSPLNGLTQSPHYHSQNQFVSPQTKPVNTQPIFSNPVQQFFRTLVDVSILRSVTSTTIYTEITKEYIEEYIYI